MLGNLLDEERKAKIHAQRVAQAAKAREAKKVPEPADETDRLVLGLVDALMPKGMFELKERMELRDLLAAFAAEIKRGG